MATRRSQDALADDGAHLANEHLDGTSQAPLPTQLKVRRLLGTKLRVFAALSPQTATLADISWRHVMAQTWELAFKECGIPSGVLSPAAAIESWK